MDKIKEAFEKVKQDINLLHNEIFNIKLVLEKLNLTINNLENKQKNAKIPIEMSENAILANQRTIQLTQQTDPTLQHITPTDTVISTDNPTHNYTLKALKTEIIDVSIGNRGVPTDKQTNRQTDKPTYFLTKNEQTPQKNTKINEINTINLESNIKEVAEILDSLDTIKKEIRLKFKHLTSQEMLVFSTLYQLEETSPEVTYKIISNTLKLSESSIRDYIQRIINKGIPIKKQKINNKKIVLSISSDLKKIASLSTIINLREL
ncbi:MAG: hypothetical protein AABW90_03900 [Nanoarchaeota archaeon]